MCAKAKTEKQDSDWKHLTIYSIGKSVNSENMAVLFVSLRNFYAFCKHFIQAVCFSSHILVKASEMLEGGSERSKYLSKKLKRASQSA